MNTNLFHNTLALSLGYKRIVNGKDISITIDNRENPDDPMIIIKIAERQKTWTFNASQTSNVDSLRNMYESNEELKIIIQAVHLAYVQAINYIF